MSHYLHRRGLLRAGLASGLLAGGLIRPAHADTALSRSTRIGAPYVTVDTPSGRLRGGHARGAIAFKGIPYGGSVSGANRFRPAPPVTPWTGVRDALELGPATMQTPGSVYGENEPPYSEDCLVLNVWTPAVNDGRKRPVMVYLHGGGYSTGSGGSPTQDGGRLAALYDVVVVAPNHRLGLLGFLYLADLFGDDYRGSGNQAMTDIVKALEWVRDTISVFGGDPGNVTVLGESGGGAKVGTLMGMPSAKGLFHKAGIASGAQLKRMPKAVAGETARRLMRALDITDVKRLLAIPAQTLLALQWAGEAGRGPLAEPTPGFQQPPTAGRMAISFTEATLPGRFGPVVDGDLLPEDPFDPSVTKLCADIPLFIGSNACEAAFFYTGQADTYNLDEAGLMKRLDAGFGTAAAEIAAVYAHMMPGTMPSERFLAIATARTMGNETGILADRKSVQGAPVYRYRWDYASNRPIAGTTMTLGSGHATDIGPTFYNWDEPGLHGDGPGVEAAARHFSALWTSFARSGVPSAPGVPAWPRYDTARRPVMAVNADCRLVDDPDAEARRMWEGLALPDLG